MKSVMRSSMLRGSRTKVGKVTRERSIPILDGVSEGRGWFRRGRPELGYERENNGSLIFVAVAPSEWPRRHWD
jgi:hypothetical protein